MTLCSVFTPSHNPEFLPEVWEHLRAQTYRDFEWVVLANGDEADTVRTAVEHLCGDDPRVRVLQSSDSNVGALKRAACDNCLGELLVELDHDDLLTEDCLEEVVSAARSCPKACFVFSDDVTMDFDGTSHKFLAENGWRQRAWEYNGKDYTVNESFPVNARSLCEVLYAPDHVRVWSRAAYRLAGGHNRDLRVGDDHELVVRTYLKGVHFHHIPKVLYLHRLNKATTSQTSLEEIQGVSWRTRDTYLHDLVREWCRRERLPMYDLGGLFNCPPSYIPIDKNPLVSRHPRGIHCDVLKGLTERDGVTPLAPSSVGCFRAYDFLEHVHADKVPALLNHLYDLLVPGGWLLTRTPSVCDDEGRCGRGAYQDPTHVSYWSSNNWWYYSRKEQAQFVPQIKCRFQAVRLANGYPSDWHRLHLIPYVWADLMSLKDDGQNYVPGLKYI